MMAAEVDWRVLTHAAEPEIFHCNEFGSSKFAEPGQA